MGFAGRDAHGEMGNKNTPDATDRPGQIFTAEPDFILGITGIYKKDVGGRRTGSRSPGTVLDIIAVAANTGGDGNIGCGIFANTSTA